MKLVPDEAATAVERHPCPRCAVPAGSACRTRAGRTVAKYHTARFILVPSLREELTVAAPPDRSPGKPWTAGPQVAAAEPEVTAAPSRIGYARCSSATQELQSQLDALTRAHCTRVFSEKISTRIKIRPELDKALTLAHEIKAAAPEQPVILAVHEMKRLARHAAELMTLSAQLQASGIRLELLSGPLTGIYDPHGMGSMLFAVLAVAAQLDRDYIREKTLEGQQAAAAKGNHGGRPKVIDPDMVIFARALRDQGTPMPDIAQKLKIQSGKNAGKHPSVASLYRALAEPTHSTSPSIPNQFPAYSRSAHGGYWTYQCCTRHRGTQGASSPMKSPMKMWPRAATATRGMLAAWSAPGRGPSKHHTRQHLAAQRLTPDHGTGLSRRRASCFTEPAPYAESRCA